MRVELTPERFVRRSVVVVRALTGLELTPDLAPRVRRRMHVRVRQAGAHHLDDRREIAQVDSLLRRTHYIGRRHRPHDCAGVAPGARKLSTASTEEVADSARHVALSEVHMRDEWRR